MTTNISRQSIYILILSVLLLIFVLLFSFLLLIPKGKDYRVQRGELKSIQLKDNKLDSYRVQKLDELKKLQKENRAIITAFANNFSKERFEKQHTKYFKTLDISKSKKIKDDKFFTTYDINATSEINSPKSFYNFLDTLNKSDWIIAVNFPITFTREKTLIKSNFSMRVYKNK